ncbi:DUF2213 domain-containing protein [Lonepinella koalarum]|uniref:DUF2213 domain-containing protein n=1 Tax=Lonepinella koalarum TaxID=53417 RepID=UPI003F6DAC60
MKFTDKTNSHRTFTKDGYLVVPATLSKIGVYDYHAKELGLNEDGFKKVARTEQSLFSDSTIKSFDGVPITLGHPADDVTAKNWKTLAVGTVRNVKRDGDMLAGEAWIYDENAIKAIQDSGIQELSCGYRCDVQKSTQPNADYEMLPMVGNHVAIVANGRCGKSVKLADGEKPMSTTRKFLDALLSVFGTKLTDEQAKEVEDKEKEEDGKEKPESDNKTPEPKAKEKPTSDEPKKETKEKPNVKDEALTAEIAQLKAENQKLKDEKAKADVESVRATTLADAKVSFANVTFADNATVQDIQRQAVVATGIFTQDEAAKLSDAELNGAYKAAKATAKKLNDKAIGDVLLTDHKPENTGLDFNTYNQQGAK